VLASGSSGNCTFISAGRTRILVDAGLSRRETIARLASIGESPENIDGIIVSHEHSDHVSGLPRLVKRWPVPVYLTHLTAPTITWSDVQPNVVAYQAGSRVTIGDIEVDTFTIPHDAIDPVGFSFHGEGIKISLVTDLGYIPDAIRYHLQGTNLLVLESNHDLEMLKVGPYPWSVKQRVMGRKGHLSNDVASGFIRDGMDSTTSVLVLGHLSEHNNHPEIARLTASQALEGREVLTRLVIAEQRRPTEAFLF